MFKWLFLTKGSPYLIGHILLVIVIAIVVIGVVQFTAPLIAGIFENIADALAIF